jgi:hypothetical protein
MILKVVPVGKTRDECRILAEKRLGKRSLKLQGFEKRIFQLNLKQLHPVLPQIYCAD